MYFGYVIKDSEILELLESLELLFTNVCKIQNGWTSTTLCNMLVAKANLHCLQPFKYSNWIAKQQDMITDNFVSGI